MTRQMVWFMVFNTIQQYFSISWRSVLLVEETRVHGIVLSCPLITPLVSSNSPLSRDGQRYQQNQHLYDLLIENVFSS
jgi:hypothetical protein